MDDVTDIAARIIKTFSTRGLTVGTAESLTGGLLGATLTAVPGSSSIYAGGVIVYSREAKMRLADVSKDVLDKYSVVSEQTAVDMALGAQGRVGADWVVAVTGVAGPDPQEGHEPGEVWISIVGPRVGALGQTIQTHRHQFSGDRQQIREATVREALVLLQSVLSPV